MLTLTKSKDFDRVFQQGISVSCSVIAVHAFKRRGKPSSARAAFCVSKKFGKAVVRNRARRRLREVYRLNEDKLATQWDIVLLAHRRIMAVQFATLEREFLNLCRRIGLLKGVRELPKEAPSAIPQE